MARIKAYLVENFDGSPITLGSGRVGNGELNALASVLDMDEGAGLATGSVDGERDPASRLDTSR